MSHVRSIGREIRIHRSSFATISALFFVAGSLAPHARAQCLEWRNFPLVVPDLDGRIDSVQVFDDGSGPLLYACGLMQIRRNATEYDACQLVTWDGSVFHRIDTPTSSELHHMVAFDDGTGPALYLASASSHVFEYQYAQWRDLGIVPGVAALVVHDDGTGPALYAGGQFTSAGGVPARNVAKWNGSAWEALGIGPGNGTEFAHVDTLASFDDGSGPALYVGGTFLGLASSASPDIARWKAGAWSGVGAGANAEVVQLATVDFGSGPALFAGGFFTSPGFHIARFDGTTWSTLPLGFPLYAGTMQALDVGGMQRLYVTARNVPGEGANSSLYIWDGSTWSHETSAPSVFGCYSGGPDIRHLAVFDEGSGPHVIAATASGTFGIPLSVLARKEGATWTRIGSNPEGLYADEIRTAQTFDDGTGPALYIGGAMCWNGQQTIRGVARWDGTMWQPVGQTLDFVNSLTTYDFGTGPSLIASTANTISRFVGGWVTLGQIYATNESFLTVLQFGPYLYAGGSFLNPTPGVNSPNIARWNPSTGFITVGSGFTAGANGQVNALATFDDGHGLALYAGGTFTSASGVSLGHVGRYDGAIWTPLGGGTDGLVDALTTYDEGSGPELYAGGTFTAAGGVPASCIAKWNGTSWSALGAGLNAQVLTLEVFDDGSGPALYAGGNFTASGNVPMERVAKWNGTTWSALGGNIDGTVWTLKSFDDGTGAGAQLFAGGVFHHAGALPAVDVAAWRGCGSTPLTKYCFGDGSDGACPCGNSGLAGRGCDNSVATGGARLNATGTTSPDTIVLHAGGELPNAPTLVFQGSVSLVQPILFGDGMRCVGGNLKRLFTTNAVGGAINVPDATQISISARSAALGDPLVPGSVRSYQTWYRDPNLSFCGPPAGDAWNLSNAVRIVW